MAIATYYLRGDVIAPLEAVDGRVEVDTYDEAILMAAVVGKYSGTISAAEVGLAADGTLVLRPAPTADKQDQELILINEYHPAIGHKRWPSFFVNLDSFPDIKVIKTAYRGKGSGMDKWSLVLAPSGTAKYIASHFLNARDVPSQTVSYRPPVSS